MMRFVDYATTLTGGQVEVTAYPAGVLAPPFEVYNAVEVGRADLGHAPPEITYRDMCRGVIPFVPCQIATLCLLALFPALATYLPAALQGF
jgi:TRAP-type mannitol/chloroaromatic compound transport system permease large subunit